MRARVAAILATALVLATVPTSGAVAPAVASTCPAGTVYLTSSSNAANDLAIKDLLEAGTGLCVTVGVQYSVLDGVDLSPYDSVYLQANFNWGSSLPSDAADALLAHVNGGGGLVTAEWSLWQVAAGFPGWVDLEPILPVTMASSSAYDSRTSVRFSRLDREPDPILDRGVDPDFVFVPSSAAGSFSRLGVKSGATAFYVATGSFTDAPPPAAAPLGSTGVTVGMAGWEVGDNGGRVFSFATTNGAAEIGDDANLRRLILNALGWVGGVVVALDGDVESEDLGTDDSADAPRLVPRAPSAVPAGEGMWSSAAGPWTPLRAVATTADVLLLETDDLSVTLRGDAPSRVGQGAVSRTGVIECEICHLLSAGEVIEVWMFSEPRLVAAHRVEDLPCQRFTIPLAGPLDGLGPVETGDHTLLLVMPTSAGTSVVAIGLEVSGPVPTSIPAGSGPAAGRITPSPASLFAMLLLLLAGTAARRLHASRAVR